MEPWEFLVKFNSTYFVGSIEYPRYNVGPFVVEIHIQLKIVFQDMFMKQNF